MRIKIAAFSAILSVSLLQAAFAEEQNIQVTKNPDAQVLEKMLACADRVTKGPQKFTPELVMIACAACSVDIGPGGFDPPGSTTPGVCDGQCDVPAGQPIQVCVPDIGNVGRPKTGKTCICVPEADAKCDAFHTTSTGRRVYEWAHSSGAYCKYGKCDGTKTCKASTGPNGEPACGCS